jgi:hypothetical protein
VLLAWRTSDSFRGAGSMTRLEWCCGCVSHARSFRGEVVWALETCCPHHREVPLRTVYPPLGNSDDYFL